MLITTSRKAPIFEQFLVDESNVKEVLQDLKKEKVLAFDTETSGLQPVLGDYIAGLSIATRQRQAFYLPFHHISPGGREVWLVGEDGEEDPEPVFVKPGDAKRERKVLEWEAWHLQDPEIKRYQEPPHHISRVLELPSEGSFWPDQLSMDEFKRVMHLLTSVQELVGHNLKYDLRMTVFSARQWFPEADPAKVRQWENRLLGGNLHDTMIQVRALRHNGWVGLKAQGERYWPGCSSDEKHLIALMARRGHAKQYHKVAPAEMCSYACTDVELTLRLHCDIYPKMIQRDDLVGIYEQERRVMAAVARMEIFGIKYCPKTQRELGEQFNDLRDYCLKQCYKLAGREFNPGSDVQVAEVFQEVFDIDLYKFCQTTYYVQKENARRARKGKQKAMLLSTNKEVMAELDHPLGHAISNYRHFAAYLSTYIDPMPQLGSNDGRVHTNYRQTKTLTGRFSSETPNMQNLPKRKWELNGKGHTKKRKEQVQAAKVRNLFIPEKGKVFVVIDYSQIEYRVMASYCEDPMMLDAYRQGLDLHQETTDNINRLCGEKILERDGGKAANFLQIYGGGIAALGLMLKKPPAITAKILDAYHETHPQVHEFTGDVADAIRARGYVRNWYGIRYYLKLDEAYAGVNYLCQGTAAFMIKEKMAAINQWLQDEDLWERARMLLQIHDELVFEVSRSFTDEFVEWVVPVMEDFNEDVPGLREGFPIPIKVDVEIAPKAFGSKVEWKGSLRKSLR